MSIKWIRYANWERVEQLSMEGWEVLKDLAPTRHDQYGTMMQWVGEGEPPQETADDRMDSLIVEFRDEVDGLFQP